MRKYKKESCHDTKSAAKKKQRSMHAAGKTAKIVPRKGGGFCVETAGKQKKRGKKKKK